MFRIGDRVRVTKGMWVNDEGSIIGISLPHFNTVLMDRTNEHMLFLVNELELIEGEDKMSCGMTDTRSQRERVLPTGIALEMADEIEDKFQERFMKEEVLENLTMKEIKGLASKYSSLAFVVIEQWEK